jgi:hypothetical protein
MEKQPLLLVAYPQHAHYLNDRNDSPGIEQVYNVKRKYDSQDVALPAKQPHCEQICEFKSFFLTFNEVDFDNLLSYIRTDMKLVKQLVHDFEDIFTPFARNRNIGSIYTTISNISSDVRSIKKERFTICPFNNKCKHRECCANVHEQEFTIVVNSFRSLQHFGNRFIGSPSSHTASALHRHLSLIEVSLWTMLSRKSFGKSEKI